MEQFPPLLDFYGRPTSISWNKYRIDWDQKVSGPQKKVVDFLRPYWQYDSVFQEALIPASKLRLDLANVSKGIIIEISPAAVHENFNKFFHKNRSGLLKKIKADEQKAIWCEKNDFLLIELKDNDIKNLSKELFLEKFDITL